MEKWISGPLAHLASKTIKEAVALLRQVFALYRTRHPAAIDPTAGIKIAQPDDDDPDPFTREEIAQLLATSPRNGRHLELLCIQFLIWAGPRVSEALALGWDDVDLDAGTVHFRRAIVRRKYKATKTKRSKRIHQLVRPALEALRELHDITGDEPATKVTVTQRDNRTDRAEPVRFVFRNTNTGKPFPSDFELRDRFFHAHCNRAGVRYRGPGQCRHTYISHMLTIDMPIEWISKQTGTSPEMIRRRYGKWIDDDAADQVAIAERRLSL